MLQGGYPACRTLPERGPLTEDRAPYAYVCRAGLDGGFQVNPEIAPTRPLVILYAGDLEAMLRRVEAAGGVVTAPIFAFPGGRRFQFRDPSGNELGVWSET